MTITTSLIVGLMCAVQPAPVGDDAALIESLREVATPLATAADLDPLIARVGDARLALLGEASHGTSEFYTWRSRISKRLITEKGFSFIAVEGDWAVCERVNRYVRGLPDSGDSAREVLLSFDRWPKWMWANEEVVELVEWLREHNKGFPPEQRVGFHGIDVYGLPDSLRKGPEYAARLDAELGEAIAAAFGCLAPYADNPMEYVRSVATEQWSCEDVLSRAVTDLRDGAERLRAIDADLYFAVKQHAMVVKQAERHYRGMLQRGPQSWNHRVDHFHGTVERLLAHYGENSKGIVWAHNTHIGDSRASIMTNQGMQNIGQLARSEHGEDNVVLIGFSTHRGTVMAGRAWEAPQQQMTVPHAMAGSLDDLLHRVGMPSMLIVMNDAREIEGFSRPRGHRAIGVTYNPAIEQQGNYVATYATRRYDVLIFLEETKALSPLHQ